MNEPISDAVRAILDGHIVLSRELASHNHYPAVDILNSISRLMIEVVSKEHHGLSMKFNDILATYREAADLINIGAYARGSNAKIDLATSKIDQMNQFLRPEIDEKVDLAQSIDQLQAFVEG